MRLTLIWLCCAVSVLAACAGSSGGDGGGADAGPTSDDDTGDDPITDDDTGDDDSADDDQVDDDTGSCQGCFVDGSCFGDSQMNPDNVCEICRVSDSTTDWSPNDDVPCDDGIWCNGEDACLARECAVHAGTPCADDGQWCNGMETCDELNRACNHLGNPCIDDGLYCNGEEACDENAGSCTHGGTPCFPWETCDETGDTCVTTTTTTTSTTTTTTSTTTTTAGTTTTDTGSTTTTSTTTSTSTTTTTTTTTTTSTTTTTQPGCQGWPLIGSSGFNDAVDLCVNHDDPNNVHIEGGWDLLTGRLVDDWYETLTLDFTDDIALVLDEAHSTPEFEYYTFDLGSVWGQFSRWVDTDRMALIMLINGPVGPEPLIFDAIYAISPDPACPDNHPPIAFYEFVARYTCDTDEFVEYYDYDPLNGWVVPVGDCYAILYAYANADCDWEGGQFSFQWYGSWVDVGDPFGPGEIECSWFTSGGLGLGILFSAEASPVVRDWHVRLRDGCGTNSPTAITTITYN